MGFRRIKTKKLGFTLIELLIVITILGILAGLGLVSFRSSQIKARDAQRKSDLVQIQKAMEMYYNDKGQYPDPTELPAPGEEWEDTEVTDGAIYMKVMPEDPKGNDYAYEYNAGEGWYRIFALLENTNDPAIEELNCGGGCGPGLGYNYYVRSSDAPLWVAPI